MKKRKSNTVRIALTIFVIVLCFYLVFYYSEKPKEESVKIEEPSKITPEIPITTTIEKIKPSKFISDLKCVDGNIMMSFTNILNTKKKISDFTFLIAGKVNRNINCELTQLEPGESTFCKDLNAGIKFRKKVLIAIGYPAHYEKAVVDCRPSGITANIIKDIKSLFVKLFGMSKTTSQ